MLTLNQLWRIEPDPMKWTTEQFSALDSEEQVEAVRIVASEDIESFIFDVEGDSIVLTSVKMQPGSKHKIIIE